MRKRVSEVRRERERERGGFLCGLDRDELECSNVRETTSPHLPFPRACAYAGKRGVVGASEGYEGEQRAGGGIGDKGSRARRRT